MTDIFACILNNL